MTIKSLRFSSIPSKQLQLKVSSPIYLFLAWVKQTGLSIVAYLALTFCSAVCFLVAAPYAQVAPIQYVSSGPFLPPGQFLVL